MIDAFLQCDMRVGKILEVHNFPEARKPAYKLTVDFGDEIGIKKSSAQITTNYTKEALIGKLIIGLVSVQPRQIGPFMSECLILGVPDAQGAVILLTPDTNNARIGGKIY